MQEIDSNKNANKFDDEIDLRELFFVLVQGKWIITYVASFLVTIGIIYSLLLPNIYQSEALLAPVDESSSLISGALSQYSGLAGLAGINLPTGETSTNHKKAIELISSLNFFEKYLMPKIFLPDLMAIESWDDKKNIIIYDDSIFQKNSNTWVRNFSYPQKLIPSAQESFEVFKDDHLNILEDNMTGYITLSIKHQSPLIAKQWIQIIVEEVNSFYRQKDKESSEKAVIYLNKQIANTNLTEIRQVTASLLEKEIQKLTLVEANKDYVFEYVYPPSLMEKKSGPNRFLIVILSLIFGIFLGMIIVLIRHYFSKEKYASERISS
ncbi:MAG: chain length determinant protein [Flavobacteriaceae bacterium]|nr:chain length determinant protein [Flavobacteriaceae bacterium]|tara:strand:- start:331 stop:1299 length:969 start_codon:yes stop_codon:yes gene_type:complete